MLIVITNDEAFYAEIPQPHFTEERSFVSSRRKTLRRAVGSALLSILLLLGLGTAQAGATTVQSVASATAISTTATQAVAAKKMTVAQFRNETSYPAKKLTAVDPLGYYKLECVSYGGWRALHSSGVQIRSGSAVAWKKWASDHGYTVNKTPAKGALAWYGKKYGSGHGHIAWVQSVNVKGAKVHLREYGWPKRHKFGERDANKGRSGWPEYFLHIQKKPKK